MKVTDKGEPLLRGQAKNQRKFSLNRSVPSVMVTEKKD